MARTLPTPSSTSSSGVARSRRMQASSSSDEQGDKYFSISSVKYRVGAPALRPLPLKTQYYSNPFFKFLDERAAYRLQLHIEEDVQRLLIERGILADDVDEFDKCVDFRVKLVYRSIPEIAGSEEPTLLIEAPWYDGASMPWQDAVRDVKNRINDTLDEHGLGQIDVTVEMCAPELTRTKYLSPIIGKPAMEEAWPRVLERVNAKLDEYEGIKPHITSICLFRLGYSKDLAQNPITLYVSLSYDSNELFWPSALSALQELLAQVGWGHVNVHLEHGIVEHHAFDLEPPSKDEYIGHMVIHDDYPQRVDMGMDISAATYFNRNGDLLRCNSTMGTLGCYVQVKTTSAPSWTTYALTSYHVVRPAIPGLQLMKSPKSGETEAAPPLPGTPVAEADLKGVFPRHVGACVPMESPSRLKHNHTIESLKERLGRGFTDTGELATKLSFFDNGHHMFGKLWAASGFSKRTPDTTDPGFTSWGDAQRARLDWALVKVDESRQGTNALPQSQAWINAKIETMDWPSPNAMEGNLKPPGSASLKTMAAHTQVFKVGATTKVTPGATSSFRAQISLNTDKHMNLPPSTELICIGWEGVQGRPFKAFSWQGDSGAVVYDGRGRAVGIVVGGRYPQQCQEGFTVVTPIEDVFASIIEHGQDKITDVRIA